MKKLEDWTDEELIQVYDLQKKYVENVINFVRHSDEVQVYNFLQIVPELNSEYDWAEYEKSIFRRNEFIDKFGEELAPQGKYIYGELLNNWHGANTLREVFEEKYQWEFAAAHPASLALFAENQEIARDTYSTEGYEKILNAIPKRLLDTVKETIAEYPKEIAEKAMRETVLGKIFSFQRSALTKHFYANMLEFQKLNNVIDLKSGDTIVGAYDLQMGLLIYQPELRGDSLTETIKNFVDDYNDKEIFKLVYGENTTALLKNAEEEVVQLAGQYDFVHTEEKIPVLENHKICMFGTEEQKLQIPYEHDPFNISEKDYAVIIDTFANKFEREGFSKKYYPNHSGNEEHRRQTYQVIGRFKSEDDIQPQWNIMFEDGKVITAKADEIISSEINERFYGEQFENFGHRPLSECGLQMSNEQLSLSEGKEKISAIINQLKSNGEKINKLKDFLDFESKNLSNAKVR